MEADPVLSERGNQLRLNAQDIEKIHRIVTGATNTNRGVDRKWMYDGRLDLSLLR